MTGGKLCETNESVSDQTVLLLFDCGREFILESEWIKIVDITQKEAFYLNAHGIPYHEDGISVTSSRHSGRSYRLCESKKNLEILKRYRNGIIAK